MATIKDRRRRGRDEQWNRRTTAARWPLASGELESGTVHDFTLALNLNFVFFILRYWVPESFLFWDTGRSHVSVWPGALEGRA